MQDRKKGARESEKYPNQSRSEGPSTNEKSLENLRLENFALSEAVKMEAQLLEQARLMSSGGRSRSPESQKPRIGGIVVADKVYSKPSPINPSLQEKFGSRLSNFVVREDDPRTQSDLRSLEDKALDEALKMDAVLMQQAAAMQKQDRAYFSRPSSNRDPPTNRVLEDRALNEANRIREILKIEESRLPHPIAGER